MFRSDITLAIEGGGDQLTMTTDCVKHFYRAKHSLNQLKEIRQHTYENRRKQDEQGGNWINCDRNKGQQGGQPQGKNRNSNKRKGNNQVTRNTR